MRGSWPPCPPTLSVLVSSVLASVSPNSSVYIVDPLLSVQVHKARQQLQHSNQQLEQLDLLNQQLTNSLAEIQQQLHLTTAAAEQTAEAAEESSSLLREQLKEKERTVGRLQQQLEYRRGRGQIQVGRQGGREEVGRDEIGIWSMVIGHVLIAMPSV